MIDQGIPAVGSACRRIGTVLILSSVPFEVVTRPDIHSRAARRSEVRLNYNSAGTTLLSCSRTKTSLPYAICPYTMGGVCQCAHPLLRQLDILLIILQDRFSSIMCFINGLTAFIGCLDRLSVFLGASAYAYYIALVSSFQLGAAATLFKARECNFFLFPPLCIIRNSKRRSFV